MVLCRCGGVPAVVSGEEKVGELPGAEVKPAAGLVWFRVGWRKGLDESRGGGGHGGDARRHGRRRALERPKGERVRVAANERASEMDADGTGEGARRVRALASGAVANLATVSTHGREGASYTWA